MNDTIAIIVTYNRKHLLARCIHKILNQTTPPGSILVIDNASTDDTVNFLAETHISTNKSITLISLEKNVGGAGGFHAGLKIALESEFTWFWLMDDDGYPAKECLELLLNEATSRDLDAISPIHVDIDDSSRTAFPIFDRNGKIISRPLYFQGGDDVYIPQNANLFNGLLIHRATLIKVGLPRAELFIRGDEVEYTRRMLLSRVSFGTLITSIFFHPSDRNERHKILLGIGSARDADNDFKNYYMYRNKGLAFKENGWLWMLPFDAVRYFYYFLIHKRGDFHGLKVWFIAMKDGLQGKLGRHPNY